MASNSPDLDTILAVMRHLDDLCSSGAKLRPQLEQITSRLVREELFSKPGARKPRASSKPTGSRSASRESR